MARLLIKTEGFENPVLELRLGVNRVGRGPENHFQIDHPSISGTHCELTLRDGTILLRDCNSTNGTYVNGHRVKRVYLRAGQTVRLGDIELFVESTDVKVVIPKFERARPKAPELLPHSAIHCDRHPESLVTHQCEKCRTVMCSECVRRLQFRGGKVRMFCPLCSSSIRVIGEPKPPAVLPDGTMLCPRHSSAPAKFRCVQCREVMCDSCVFRFRPKGGKPQRLCLLCSSPVEIIGAERQTKQTLSSYLKQTVRMPFLGGKVKED